jgi:hypothetical protein
MEPADPAQGRQPVDARHPLPPSWDPTGTMAMRVTVPSPGGATQRYQLRYWQPQSTGADYWQSYGLLIGDDWKVDSNGNLIQVANNGTTFTNIGAGHRNNSNGDNGPGGGVGSMSTRLGSPCRLQVGFNFNGQVSQNGDGGQHLTAVVDNPRKLTWYDVMWHIKWSHGSDGFAEYYLNGTKVGEFTGQTLGSTINTWEHRCGFYDGGSIDHTRSTYYALSDHRPDPGERRLSRVQDRTAAPAAVRRGTGGGTGGGTTGTITPPSNVTAVPSTTTAGTIVVSADRPTDTNFDYFAVRWSLQQLAPGDAAWNRITTGGETRSGQGGYFTLATMTSGNRIVAWPSGQPTGTRVYFYVSKVGTAAELAVSSVVSAVVDAVRQRRRTARPRSPRAHRRHRSRSRLVSASRRQATSSTAAARPA